MKKVISRILAICMTVVVCIPCVSAAKTPNDELEYAGLDRISIGDLSVTGDEITSLSEPTEDGIDPQVIVSEGTNAFITRIIVYPGIRSGNDFLYRKDWGYVKNFAGDWHGGTVHLSPANTKKLTDTFYDLTGYTADAWFIEAHFDVINDRWGSYGKYFEFSPEGNCYFPDKESNGKIKYDLPRTNVDQNYGLCSYYSMPQDTSGTYSIGLSGGFWYYSVNAKKELNHAAHALVYFNSTI